MERRQPVPGSFYKHFKGQLYQITAIAKHSETGEKMVVYQAMYGEFLQYVRPYDMFMSEVDRDKYPNVEQIYRFEEYIPGQTKSSNVSINVPSFLKSAYDEIAKDAHVVKVEAREAAVPEEEVSEVTMVEPNLNKEHVDNRLIEFLDADTYTEKLKIFSQMQDDITDKLLNDIAAVLDISMGPSDDLDERFENIRRDLATYARFERNDRV